MTIMACGSKGHFVDATMPMPDRTFSADLESLIKSYEADANTAGAPVEPEFRAQLQQVIWVDDLGQQDGQLVLGRCDRMNENHPDPAMRFRTIKVRKPDAEGKVGGMTLDATTLKTIVYHELGHCLHDFRGHLPEASHQIMSAALPKERFASFNELLKEHFALVHAEH